MSGFTGVRCDVCGKIKADVNKWFHVWIADGIVCVSAVRTPHGGIAVFDFCGEACVSKKLSELLPGLHAQ